MSAYTDYKSYRSLLESGQTTVVDTVRFFLDRIEQFQSLNAFVEVFDEEIKTRAVEIDSKIKNGTAGKLAGMVIAVKDNLTYEGHSVTASSRILHNFKSIYSSTAINRLIKEDALIIGRCNCDEFAMGASNETSVYGPVLNFDNADYVPGGSSGGSAVAVQAQLCHAALGSDTGGSIRQPAAFCNLVGIKPTYGTVSRHGLLAYASSFDQIGPLTSTIYDNELILETIAGPDEFDATMIQENFDPQGFLSPDNKSIRFGYIKECFGPGVDKEIKDKIYKLFHVLKEQGHIVEEVTFPLLDALVPAYYVLTTAEASSNLSRYQGLHFGFRSDESKDLETMFKKSRSEGLGREVKRRIMLGTFVLSSEHYDAYYTKAQRVRQLIQKQTRILLSQYEFLLTPTTPETAFKFGAKSADPVTMYLADIFTVQANLAGNPAISIPAGRHKNGMAFGIQIMSDYKTERKLYQSARLIEKHLRGCSE